jgi:hypothetical protein
MVRVINFACDKRFEIVETGNDCSRGGEGKTPRKTSSPGCMELISKPTEWRCFLNDVFKKRMLYDDIEI